MRILILVMALFLLAGCSDDEKILIQQEDNSQILPTVTITSPKTGNIIRDGTHGIKVSAYHESGIKFVRLTIGLKDARIDETAPYIFIWVVGEDANPPIPEGKCEICALAVANNGNSIAHCIDVTVDY